MISHLISGLESWCPWSVEEIRSEGCSGETMSKITKVGTSSLQQISAMSEQLTGHRTFSPIRLFMCASLIVGTRSQLTEPFPARFELSSLDGTNGFVINGEAKGDQFGWSVSSAGDFNGDSIDDVVIGARYATPSNRQWAGKSYVLFGSRDIGSGGQFDLSGLDGMNGFILHGEQKYDYNGYSVSTAGDMNGDGLGDILVASMAADTSGTNNVGKSYVVFGTRMPYKDGILELSELGNNGVIINGAIGGGGSGNSVSNAGDVNGDGLSDILIGAAGANKGQTYVVFGTRDFSPSFKINLSSLDGINGFYLKGERFGGFGESVSSVGDMNGDGLSDFVVGNPAASSIDKRNAGKSYVIFGSRDMVNGGLYNLSQINGTNGFIFFGQAESHFCGKSVSSAGDVNGDGFDDCIIGCAGISQMSMEGIEHAYVIFGHQGFFTPQIMDFSNITRTNISPITTDDFSGWSFSSAGDINGDGLADIVIGATNADPLGRMNAGRVYVIFGNRDKKNISKLNVSILDGIKGFMLNGEFDDDKIGYSVSSAGDFNGDGIDDLLIGAPWTDPSNQTSAGKTFVIFGRNLSLGEQTPSIPKESTISFHPSMVTNTPFSSTTVNSLGSSLSSSNINNFGQQTSFINMKFSHVSTTNSTPLIIGTAAGVVAFVCSVFGIAFFFYRKNSNSNDLKSNIKLSNENSVPEELADYVAISSLNLEIRSARPDNNYAIISTRNTDSQYNDWPQDPQPQTTDHYDQRGLDQLNREMDQHQKGEAAKRHEGYDDIPNV